MEHIEEDQIQARHKMVNLQIKKRGISDEQVLAALEKVPRHEFVPEDKRHLSYKDQPIAIGWGQTISQPYIVAYMTQELGLTNKDNVLEIGTGCGYQTAVLAEIAKKVYSIEIVPELAVSAKKILTKLGYKNVETKQGDGYAGWPEHAPFDAILVAAAPKEIPQPLIDQLKVGGRMLIPVGGEDQQMIVLTKTPSGINKRISFAVQFVPMTGRAQQK